MPRGDARGRPRSAGSGRRRRRRGDWNGTARRGAVTSHRGAWGSRRPGWWATGRRRRRPADRAGPPSLALRPHRPSRRDPPLCAPPIGGLRAAATGEGSSYGEGEGTGEQRRGDVGKQGRKEEGRRGGEVGEQRWASSPSSHGQQRQAACAKESKMGAGARRHDVARMPTRNCREESWRGSNEGGTHPPLHAVRNCREESWRGTKGGTHPPLQASLP